MQETALEAYRKLYDGISDMVEDGRLRDYDIPEDWQWLMKAMEATQAAEYRDSKDRPPCPQWVITALNQFKQELDRPTSYSDPLTLPDSELKALIHPGHINISQRQVRALLSETARRRRAQGREI
jgi:hypothetical protein